MEEDKCPSLLDALDFLKLPNFKILPEPQKKNTNFLYNSDSESEGESESNSYEIPEKSEGSLTQSSSLAEYEKLDDFEKELDIEQSENAERSEGSERSERSEGSENAESLEGSERSEGSENAESLEGSEVSDGADGKSESISSEFAEFNKVNEFVEHIKDFIEEGGSPGEGLLKLVEKDPLTYDLIRKEKGNEKERVILRKELNRKKIKKIIDVIDYIVEKNLKK